MTIAHLSRIVSFSAAHRYFRPDWSAERNTEVFGPCANEHGHGHNYQCRVTVAGALDAETGMVMGLGDLDAILQQEVVERFDHKFINHDVPEFALGKLIPTGETLAVFVWERVAARLPRSITLIAVRVQEDPYLYAEYRGEDAGS
jgi:6-pyruvoyltetrahydropterin/6-carboxytetrahydropterin synthase